MTANIKARAATLALVTNWALSILEKLHVPDGWCSSGLRANEYTQIESFEEPAAAAVLFKPP